MLGLHDPTSRQAKNNNTASLRFQRLDGGGEKHCLVIGVRDH